MARHLTIDASSPPRGAWVRVDRVGPDLGQLSAGTLVPLGSAQRRAALADSEGSRGVATGRPARERGKTVHGEPANAGHRVLAPDDAEVEAYLETALHAPAPDREAEAGVATGPVAVLDFGSQFAQLIARRIRELDVYSELLPHDTPYEELERRGTRAIILSGGPASVYDEGAPKPDPAVWSGRIPVLGICYGAQLMARELGGDVLATGKREYGPALVQLDTGDNLFRDFKVDFSDEAIKGLNPGDRHVLENVRDVVLLGKEDMTCLSCHQVHAQSTKKHHTLAKTDYCLSCHNATGSMKQRKPYEMHSKTCGY